MATDEGVTRRRVLQAGAAGVAAAAPGTTLLARRANAAEPINFATWSAATDQVKAHLAGFEKQGGAAVAYTNAPFAQYREAMITKFTGGAPVDVLWVSDSWLPEFAEAGWIEPIDRFPRLMAYDAETSDFNKSVTYKGKQYGCVANSDEGRRSIIEGFGQAAIWNKAATKIACAFMSRPPTVFTCPFLIIATAS